MPITTPSRVCISVCESGRPAARRTRDLGEAEVENLDAAAAVTMTLAGLRSRWTMPFSCAAARASASAAAMSRSDRRAGRRRDEAVERLALDELHGEEMDAVGFLDGGIVTMWGDRGRRAPWPRAGSAPAVRVGPLGGEHLQGDVAAELRVGARYTSPIPPAPIGATISWDPRRVPGWSVMELTRDYNARTGGDTRGLERATGIEPATSSLGRRAKASEQLGITAFQPLTPVTEQPEASASML